MTLAVLTRILDEEFLALLRGEADECLVCGEPVEAEGERVECPACGTVLEPPPAAGPGELTLLPGGVRGSG